MFEESLHDNSLTQFLIQYKSTFSSGPVLPTSFHYITGEMLFPWQDPRVAYLSVGVSPPRPLHHECTSLLHLSWPAELPVWVYEPYLPADLKQGMDLSGEHSYLTSSTCIKHKGSLYKWWLEGQVNSCDLMQMLSLFIKISRLHRKSTEVSA